MSKVIKAHQVRKNPYLIKKATLDAILSDLPDPDCKGTSSMDTGPVFLEKQGYSSFREFEESILKRQAKIEEDIAQAEITLLKAEEESKEIYKKAYETGFKNGQSQGKEKSVEELQDLLSYIKDLGQAIASAQEESIVSAKESIGKLALAVAGKIVKREIQINKDVVLGIVSESLEAIKGVKDIKVRVSAEDIDNVKEHKSILLQAADNIPDFELIEDPRIEQGGCIIETEFGILDARIDSQLQEVGRAFFGDKHN